MLAASASSSVVTVDTLGMSTTLTFAVCYAETDGAATDSTWADSGIRLTVSKVTSVEYGEAHSSLPVRTWRSTNIMAATSRLPQVAGAQITYVGDLANAQWLSVVDASQNSNNPCVAGASAASAAGTGYSGAQKAGTGTKLVTIPQSTLLDDSNTYTVCYASGDGSNTDTTTKLYFPASIDSQSLAPTSGADISGCKS